MPEPFKYRRILLKLSGKAHTLETAIVISEEGKPVWRYLARPKLTVRPLSDAFIDTYVEAVGEPLLSTVGAYQLEGLGVFVVDMTGIADTGSNHFLPGTSASAIALIKGLRDADALAPQSLSVGPVSIKLGG